MDQRERREIFKDAGATYDSPDTIRQLILRFYDQAQELDQGRITRGRYHQRGQGRHRTNFVREEGDEKGTDLTDDVVLFPEETDLLKRGESTFNPQNPTSS